MEKTVYIDMKKKYKSRGNQTKYIPPTPPYNDMNIFKKHKDFIFIWDQRITKPLDYNYDYGREIWTFPTYCKPYLNTFFLDWNLFKYDIIAPNENVICVFKKTK